VTEQSEVPEFLNVTLYVDDIADLRAYYHDFLGLPIEFEESGHIAVMGKVAVHDPTEGPVDTCRLYFLVDDPGSYAKRAADLGQPGVLRSDGHGNPAWESKDAFGNSVVLLKRPRRAEEAG
jgi:catechol 2,3-dioxygenase-like lactoylglutathione lyase family enzyme